MLGIWSSCKQVEIALRCQSGYWLKQGLLLVLGLWLGVFRRGQVE